MHDERGDQEIPAYCSRKPFPDRKDPSLYPSSPGRFRAFQHCNLVPYDIPFAESGDLPGWQKDRCIPLRFPRPQLTTKLRLLALAFQLNRRSTDSTHSSFPSGFTLARLAPSHLRQHISSFESFVMKDAERFELVLSFSSVPVRASPSGKVSLFRKTVGVSAGAKAAPATQ